MTPSINKLTKERRTLLETAKTPTGKFGTSKKAKAILAEAAEMEEQIRKECDEAAKRVVYSCRATYYAGDRPHFWSFREDGVHFHFVHADDVVIGSTLEARECPEHAKVPTFLTAELIRDAVAAATDFADWVAEIGVERWHGCPDAPKLTVSNAEQRVTFEMSFHAASEKLNAYSQAASGHTSFWTSRGSYTFDRTGVEDSFYVGVADATSDVLDKLRGQLKKIEETRARHEKSESVPGIGYLVTPESKAQIVALLASGKSHTFHPSGFGTGYRVSARGSRYARRAKPETEAFFGVGALYVESIDCD